MTANLLCLGGGVESLPIIQYVRNAGYRPVIFDRNPHCAAAEWVKQTVYDHRHRYISRRVPQPDESRRDPAIFVEADCYSAQASLIAFQWRTNQRQEDIRTFLSPLEIAGVLCCAIDAPEVQARLAERLRCSTIGEKAASYGANKLYQVRCLAEANILVPDTIVVNPEMEWNEVCEYDIVKPVDSRGARGVRYYNAHDYRKAFVEALSYSPKQRMIIAQKFVDGMQLSTESVVYNGQVIMTAIAQRNYDNTLGEYAPYIIEDGSNSPIQFENENTYKGIITAIEHACSVLGWNNCTVKGDIIVHPTGTVYIVELAPRLSGGYFASHIIPLAYGWDILGDAVSLAVGKPPELKLTRETRHVCQRFIFQKPEWIGKRITYIPQESDLDFSGRHIADTGATMPFGVELLRWNYNIGDILKPIKSHPDRLGMVLTVGSTEAEAESLAKDTIAYLHEEIKVE